MTRLALACVLTVAGCASGDPTEIFVVVDTDLVSRDEALPAGCADWGSCRPIGLVVLEILEEGRSPRTGYTAIVREGYTRTLEPPVSWGVVSPRDPDRRVEIVARGYEHSTYGEEPSVERRAQLAFRDAEVRTLCLDLMSACVGVTCPAGTTCVGVDATGAPDCSGLCLDSERLPLHGSGDGCAWPVSTEPCTSLAR